MNDYLITLETIKELSHTDFIKKSYDSVDIYGLGLSLMTVLNRTSNFISKEFAQELGALLYKMYHPNLNLRLSVDEATVLYEQILENNEIMRNHMSYTQNR